MIWLFLGYIAHVTEMLLITEVIRDMNPFIYVGLYYLFSSVFISIYHFGFKRRHRFFDFNKVKANKALVFGFIGGGFFGNVLWFGSLFLIGIGLTSFLLIFIRVIVTVYSYMYMNDRYSADKAVAFGLSIVFLMLFSFEVGQVNIWGVTAAILSCVGFSIETICRKRLVEQEFRPDNVVLLRNISLCILSWVSIVILSVFGFVSLDYIQTVSYQSYGLIIIAAILGGVIANLMVLIALKTIKLSFIEALSTTKPIVMAAGGVIFLGEYMNGLQWLYGGLIVLSVIYFMVPFSFVKKRKQ